MKRWRRALVVLVLAAFGLSGVAVEAAPKLPAAMKKNAQKKTTKTATTKKAAARKSVPKKVAKKKVSKAKKYSLGLKGGMLPLNDMNSVRPAGAGGAVYNVDYDLGVIWGIGAQFQYRLRKDFYLLSELMYWYPSVRDTNHPQATPQQLDYRERDGLFNLGVGLRYNFLGGDHTKDRVYLKGHVGFADYIADEANLDHSNRAGIYFNGAVGIEHMFARSFTVFADGGYFYNSFLSPGDGEDEANLHGLMINAGFLFHWD